MNKIVRNRYPAASLPADLRDGLPAGARVRIEVELEHDPQKKISLAKLVGSARNIHGESDQVLAAIRSLRDEW